MTSRLIAAARERLRGGSATPDPTSELERLLAALSHEERWMAERQMRALPEADLKIVERSLPYTLTGVPRLHALTCAVRYCVANGIEGPFAECGVWRGGSVLAMILTLQELGQSDRDIYLYDTFEGMTEPTEHDVSPFYGRPVDMWAETGGKIWPEWFNENTFSEALVRETLLGTGYPEARLHFVRGPVEQTIPERAPERLALARLDTDWYESTRHELIHLYPRLEVGGVLIIDDYAEWAGCKKAVDEYFEAEGLSLFLSPVDYGSRVAVKP